MFAWAKHQRITLTSRYLRHVLPTCFLVAQSLSVVKWIKHHRFRAGCVPNNHLWDGYSNSHNVFWDDCWMTRICDVLACRDSVTYSCKTDSLNNADFLVKLIHLSNRGQVRATPRLVTFNRSHIANTAYDMTHIIITRFLRCISPWVWFIDAVCWSKVLAFQLNSLMQRFTTK